MATGNFLVMARRAFLALALGLAVLPAASADAWAEPARPAREEAPVSNRVKVDVMVVYANNSGRVDPQLRDLQRQLEMLKFTGFEVLSTHSAQLAPNQEGVWNVEGGRKLQVTLLSKDEESARVQIELFKDNEKKTDTTITIRRGRTFLIGGPKYQDGNLIFPISVTY